MAVVTIGEGGRRLTEPAAIARFLRRHGIEYRRLDGVAPLHADAGASEVLQALAEPVATLKREGGYETADVVDVHSGTPGLASMLEKFGREHWHDEDEVRLVVAGRGVFHVRPKRGAVFRIEVGAGDVINVPAGTWHWFHLCEESRIRAIRLFRDPAGWTPRYTDSGEETRHEPLCFGPRYLSGSDGR